MTTRLSKILVMIIVKINNHEIHIWDSDKLSKNCLSLKTLKKKF